jgi:hypothetical protein
MEANEMDIWFNDMARWTLSWSTRPVIEEVKVTPENIDVRDKIHEVV